MHIFFSFLLLNFCFLEPIHIDNSSEIQKVTSVLNFFHNCLETSQSAEHLQKWVSTSNGSAVTYMSAKPYAAASIGIRGFRMLAIFFILIAKLRIVVGYSKFAVYILAFCFSQSDSTGASSTVANIWRWNWKRQDC